MNNLNFHCWADAEYAARTSPQTSAELLAEDWDRLMWEVEDLRREPPDLQNARDAQHAAECKSEKLEGQVDALTQEVESLRQVNANLERMLTAPDAPDYVKFQVEIQRLREALDEAKQDVQFWQEQCQMKLTRKGKR